MLACWPDERAVPRPPWSWGVGPGVNQAYDLAQFEQAVDDMWGERQRRQNKGMKQTKGGWSWSEAW